MNKYGCVFVFVFDCTKLFVYQKKKYKLIFFFFLNNSSFFFKGTKKKKRKETKRNSWNLKFDTKCFVLSDKKLLEKRKWEIKRKITNSL